MTVWLTHRFTGELELPPRDVDLQLLDLAKRTNEQWATDGIPDQDGQQVIMVSRNEDLMTRESLILELTELESDIIKTGVEMEIVEDLQAYLRTLNGSENVATLNAYISGIIDWMKPFFETRVDCRLERANLYPASVSNLPVLAFEISGRPQAMGESLLRYANYSQWQLDDLDLLMTGHQTSCWLRGSYSFSPVVDP